MARFEKRAKEGTGKTTAKWENRQSRRHAVSRLDRRIGFNFEDFLLI